MTTIIRVLDRWSSLYWLGKTQLAYRWFFGSLGTHSRIMKPLKFRNPQNIYIGAHVTIHKHTWLFTAPTAGDLAPKMSIGDGTTIGNFNHITCINRVEIGRKVLTADRVHISDNTHGFEDPNTPVIDQPVRSKGPVVIEDGTWLGENVSVLSCHIGRNCVIGANAVVTKDVPDFCVAVGAPARVIKRFNCASGKWERV